MCVIIIKKKGQTLPTKEMLTAAYEQNSDGIGYVTTGGHYWRGLDFDKFYADFVNHVSKEDGVILHFRWATHGSVKKSNCHPFKGQASGDTYYFAHNGVLSIPSVNDKTDSEICFRTKILPRLRKEGLTREVRKYIGECAETSRFALMHGDRIMTWGEWCTVRGFLCSNSRFAWRMMDSARRYPYYSWMVNI